MSVLQMHSARAGLEQLHDQPASVHVIWGDVWIRILEKNTGVYVSLAPDEARELALNLTAAADGAEREEPDGPSSP